MKRQNKWLGVFGTVIGLSWCMAARSGMAAAGAEDLGPWEVGTRMTHFILLDNTRGTPNQDSIMGTATMLKEEQDYLPVKVYVQYRLLPYLAVGISYDKLGAEASDSDGADGTGWLSGPLAYVSGRYLNDTRFTPYGELGLAYYFAEFEHSSGWGTGPGKWASLDDTTGYYAAIGCEIGVHESWSVDLYSRYMNAEAKGEWFTAWQRQGDVVFPMSNITLGIGAKYTF